jgi:hypothetical protein
MSLCPIYSRIWKGTDRPRHLLDANHFYTVGTDETPEFLRLDEYNKHEPARGLTWSGELPTKDNYQGNRTNNARKCECGKPDAWRCWYHVFRGAMLGGARVARTGRGYTVYPDCQTVNYQILAAVASVIPLRKDANDIPCEEARDLASHLAMNGLYKQADGSVSTYFLVTEAAAYFRKTQSATCLSHDLAHNRQPTKEADNE